MLRVLMVTVVMQGCGLFGGDGGKEAADAAKAQMQGGDIPGAAAAFERAAKENPESVDAASGAALAAMMRGDLSAADAHLERVQATAGERQPEVLMRRALVAQKAKDWDAMRQYGEASGLAPGLLLAGEAALADGDREDAAAYFERVSGGGAEVTARGYLSRLSSEDPIVAGLSEAQALWALGMRKVAVTSVADLLVRYPESEGDKADQLLLWSGRAASVRETDTASTLLRATKAEGEQVWRKTATEAIVSCAKGDASRCIRKFEGLEGDAPEDGLADAKVTAAMLIGPMDAQAAKDLAGDYISEGAGRALWNAGARRMARNSTPEGALLNFIESTE
jgi:tetratricopeptide (TPR) repeat protein